MMERKPMYHSEILNKKNFFCLNQCHTGLCVGPDYIFTLPGSKEFIYRHNADLFDLSLFKVKTRTDRILVQEILFAVVCAAEEIEVLVDRF